MNIESNPFSGPSHNESVKSALEMFERMQSFCSDKTPVEVTETPAKEFSHVDSIAFAEKAVFMVIQKGITRKILNPKGIIEEVAIHPQPHHVRFLGMKGVDDETFLVKYFGLVFNIYFNVELNMEENTAEVQICEIEGYTLMTHTLNVKAGSTFIVEPTKTIH